MDPFLESISKKIPARGLRSLWGATEAAGEHNLRVVPAARAGQRIRVREAAAAPAAPHPVQPQVREIFNERGDQAVMDARRAMGARKLRLRRRKQVAGVGGAAVASGSAVLAGDAAFRKKKAS